MRTIYLVLILSVLAHLSIAAANPSIKDVKSVIIPDQVHGAKWMLESEIAILERIKRTDPSFDCVFLEVEPKATDAIQSFLGGQEYIETVGLWISLSSRQAKVPFVNIIPDWYILKIHELGFRIIGMDTPLDSELGRQIIPLIANRASNPELFGKLVVSERSRIFAETVIKNLNNGSCQKAVIVVGEGHLDGSQYKPVQKHLMDAGITGVFQF